MALKRSKKEDMRYYIERSERRDHNNEVTLDHILKICSNTLREERGISSSCRRRVLNVGFSFIFSAFAFLFVFGCNVT